MAAVLRRISRILPTTRDMSEAPTTTTTTTRVPRTPPRKVVASRPQNIRTYTDKSSASKQDSVLEYEEPIQKPVVARPSDSDIVECMHRLQVKMHWLGEDKQDKGVVLRQSDGTYISSNPGLLQRSDNFSTAIQIRGWKAAMTVCSSAIDRYIEIHRDGISPLDAGPGVEIVHNMTWLLDCDGSKHGAVIENRQMMIVWADDPKQLLPLARKLEWRIAEWTCRRDLLGCGTEWKRYAMLISPSP